MVKYGNTISLMDATYKTTKYELALFFVAVKTNVGYTAVADFVLQSETAEQMIQCQLYCKRRMYLILLSVLEKISILKGYSQMMISWLV